MEDSNRRSGRRRRRRRSGHDEALRKWAKDDVPAGDEKEQANVGLLVAVIIGLILLLCLYYIVGQLHYEPPL